VLVVKGRFSEPVSQRVDAESRLQTNKQSKDASQRVKEEHTW
jgi:hypothetical protein